MQKSYLVIGQVIGQAANKYLERRVANHRRDHAGHISRIAEAWHRLVISRSSDFQRLTLEHDAVKGHGRCRFIDGSELEEGEVFVQINLHGDHRHAFGLRQTGQTHLLVEKVHHWRLHLLFCLKAKMKCWCELCSGLKCHLRAWWLLLKLRMVCYQHTIFLTA